MAEFEEFDLERESWKERICRIEERVNQIYEVVKMSVTQAQLDAGLSALLTAEAARDVAVTSALNDLIAKVNAGSVPPADFTAELAQIATLQANAAALTQTATTDDPGPTVVPTTPVSAPAAS